jgi:tetratricopeptide (TPR) repeat protein
MERALGAAGAPDEIAYCRYYLGELAFNSGRLDDADAQYGQGLALVPDDPSLTQGRAKVAAARGQYDKALDGYRLLVSRAPLPQYLLEYAELLEVSGKNTEAGQQYAVLAQQQRLMESQGATDDLSAAMVAADHGDKAEALRRAETEWGRRQSVFVADAMAWALHVNGRDAEALPYAEKAAAFGWRNATFAYHRGMILLGLDRPGEAEEHLARAVATNPYFSLVHAPIARQRLAELRSGR